MTPEKARQLFETAGGVDKINSEAQPLFNHAGGNIIDLRPENLTNAPAISSLYSICKKYAGHDYNWTYMEIVPENGRHIEVQFGNNWATKHIYIFDPTTMALSNMPANCFRVASNIFVSR